MKELYLLKTVEIDKQSVSINQSHFDKEPNEQQILEFVDECQAPRYELSHYIDEEIQSIKIVDMKEMNIDGVVFSGVVKILCNKGFSTSIHIDYDGEFNGLPFEAHMSQIYETSEFTDEFVSDHTHDDKNLIFGASYQAYSQYNDLYVSMWRESPLNLEPNLNPFIEEDGDEDFFDFLNEIEKTNEKNEAKGKK
ncbi:hypothetical protein Q5O89_16785 [Peribacillus frigoritolerans]|nr:hypothetical protein [Peribacillus frigoritolerans]